MKKSMLAPRSLRLLLGVAAVALVSACPPATDASAAAKEAPASEKTPTVAPQGLGDAPPIDGSAAHGIHGSVSRSQISVLPMTAPVVTVDDVTFTRAELERAIAQHAVVAGIPPSAIDAPTRDALEAPAYEKLVERHLLGREAKKRKLWPTDDEVKVESEKLKKTIPEGKTFAEALQSMGTDEKSFMEDLASDVAIGKLFESMKKEAPALDEAALKKVYEENKDKFVVPDTAEASHILVRVAKDAKPEEVSAALEKAKVIRKEVAGKDEATFKKVATEKSEDPSAKANGGSLGSFARGDMLPAFEEVAFKLKAGALSEPVRSDFGWHIIRGGGSKKGSQKTFEEMKPMIAQREEMKGFMEKVDALIDSLRKQAKIVRVQEPAPSPFSEDGKGSQVPSWKPSGGNVKPGATNPHAPPPAGH